MTNVNNCLPSGWVETNFSQIGSYIQRGKSPKYIDYSELPVVNQKCIRWSGIQKEYLKYVHPEQFNKWSPERYLKDGDILWNSTGTGTIGRACLYKENQLENAVVDSHVTIIRTYKNHIIPEYIFFFIMSPAIQKEIEKMQTGSTNQVELSKNSISITSVPLAPFNEQKRIVDKIEKLFSDLDDAEANLKKVQKLIKTYRQSVLKAAVTGELTKEWREKNKGKYESGEELLKQILKAQRDQWKGKGRYQEPKATDTSNLPELPEGWVWVNLASIILDGPQNGVYLPKNLYGQGVPILRIDDFQQHWIRNKDSLQKVKALDKDIKLYSLKNGDFVINRVNSTTHLGKSVLISKSHENCLFESNMMRFNTSNLIYKEYLSLFLISEFGRKLLIQNCKHAVNQASINQLDVKETPIPLPPYSEQKIIVTLIENNISQQNIIASNLKILQSKCANLYQSILKSSFSGQLVSQDPSDEPASELLNRIQGEKNSKLEKPKIQNRDTVSINKKMLINMLESRVKVNKDLRNTTSERINKVK